MNGPHSSNPVEIRHGSGTTAVIHTGYGFNCTSFTVATPDGPVDLIWSVPDFGPDRPPMLSGIPVLFPFGGRLVGNTFRWQGTEYTITDGIIEGGSAIHGLVLNRPWRVLEEIGDRVVGEFQASIDDPALLSQWPADFRITMAYEVTATALTCDIVIDNPDQLPLPYGFATHGYYRTPLGQGDGEACELTVPASSRWVLDDNAIPTGEIRPVEPELDLRKSSRSMGASSTPSTPTWLPTRMDQSLASSATLPLDARSGSTWTVASGKWSSGTRPTARPSRSSPTPASSPPSTSRSAATTAASAYSAPANQTPSASRSSWLLTIALVPVLPSGERPE